LSSVGACCSAWLCVSVSPAIAIAVWPSLETNRSGEMYGLRTVPTPGCFASVATARATVALKTGSLARSFVECSTSVSENVDCCGKSFSIAFWTASDCEPGTANPPCDSLVLSLPRRGPAARSAATQIPMMIQRRRWPSTPSR